MRQLFFEFEDVCSHYRRPWGSYGVGDKTVYIESYRRRKRR